MLRHRVSSRLARKQKNNENGWNLSIQQNDHILEDFDLLSDGTPKSQLYPMFTQAPISKKVNIYNLAEIPSLKSDEDSLAGIDNLSQSSESSERTLCIRKNYGKRKNVNCLIEARNKFRQLLSLTQTKNKPNSTEKSTFDGYDLKTRRIKYDPKRLKKDQTDSSPNKYDFNIQVHDKTIDVSCFSRWNPNTPLPIYSICRIWARTKYGIPDLFKSKRNVQPSPMLDYFEFDGPYTDSSTDILHLPKPIPLPKDADGNEIILRIPERVRSGIKEKISPDVSFINSLATYTAKQLLELNMPRWKKCRKENIEALKKNEKRYRHSFAVIRSIFEKYALFVCIF